MADKKGTKRPKGGIGRGLNAFIKEHVAPEAMKAALPAQPNLAGPDLPGFRIEVVSVGLIDVNPDQPRKHLDEESIETLAESIKQHGLINPLTVRPHPDPERKGRFQLIAGERRLRAARLAGLTQVPVIIQESDDVGAYEKALVENIQRENLDPIEEAEAYQYLLQARGYSQEELARRVGRSRAAIANKIRLLNLPPSIREMISTGQLTEGHGRALLMADDPAFMEELAQQAVEKGLSVRDVERLASRKGREAPSRVPVPSYFSTVQKSLQERLGTKVKLRPKKRGGGSITIEFYSEEELSHILSLLGIDSEE